MAIVRDHNPTIDRARSLSVYNTYMRDSTESKKERLPSIIEIENISSNENLNVINLSPLVSESKIDTSALTEISPPTQENVVVSKFRESNVPTNISKGFLHAIKHNHVFLGIFTSWNKSYKKIDRVLIYHA